MLHQHDIVAKRVCTVHMCSVREGGCWIWSGLVIGWLASSASRKSSPSATPCCVAHMCWSRTDAYIKQHNASSHTPVRDILLPPTWG